MSATDPKASAGAGKTPTEVKPFVVGQASSLSAQELNRFRIHNEGIVRSVGARLSLFLRAEFAFDLEHLDAMELGRYAAKAEPIENYLLFQVDRFPGIGVVGFPKPLALAIGCGEAYKNRHIIFSSNQYNKSTKSYHCRFNSSQPNYCLPGWNERPCSSIKFR